MKVHLVAGPFAHRTACGKLWHGNVREPVSVSGQPEAVSCQDCRNTSAFSLAERGRYTDDGPPLPDPRPAA